MTSNLTCNLFMIIRYFLLCMCQKHIQILGSTPIYSHYIGNLIDYGSILNGIESRLEIVIIA